MCPKMHPWQPKANDTLRLSTMALVLLCSSSRLHPPQNSSPSCPAARVIQIASRYLLPSESDKDSCPEKHRHEGPLAADSSIESGSCRNRGKTDRRAGAFFERLNRIDRQILKAFNQPAGPADLHPIDHGRGAEAKVNSHVVIGDIAGTAANFVDQRARAGFHRDLRADA